MDILEKVEKYLEFQREVYGDNTLVELPDYEPEPVVISMTRKKEIDVIDSIISKAKEDFKVDETKAPTIEKDWSDSFDLAILKNKIHNCQECPLGATRKSFVFGSGNPNADIMIVGEAPGADEDEQGLPFVGRAGQLLTKILEAVNLSRDEVYIANIVKCRPPENRRPATVEIDTCEPYLKKQIELIKPQFILSLGLTSVDTLLKKSHKMSEIRGRLTDYHGIKMLVTYHPAALLRNPNWKKFVWEDVQFLRKLYDDYLESK